jgi:competence protein ComEC
MKANKKGITRGKLITILIATFIAVLFTALIVADIFVPLKYLSAYTVTAEEKADGDLNIAFVDVGYGDCVVVQLPDGKNLLIDGGDGTYGNNLNILKYLNSNGIDKIDYLICSSIRSEHCGGLTEILKYKQVEKAYIPYCKNTRITTEYGEFYTALRNKNIPYEYSASGISVIDEENNCFFTFLSPTDYSNPNSEYNDMNSDATKENINNASAVVWLQYGDKGFVFCSDAGQAALENILESYTFCKKAGVEFCRVGDYSVDLTDCVMAQAAGHGGDKCTYADWYKTLSPEEVVISVGKNYSDCPSLAALSDITDCGAKAILTSESGNVKFTISA